jgi:hypothetical protein
MSRPWTGKKVPSSHRKRVSRETLEMAISAAVEDHPIFGHFLSPFGFAFDEAGPRNADAVRRRIASDREAKAAVLHHWYWGKRDVGDLDDQE